MRTVFALLAAAIIAGGCGRASDEPAGVAASDDAGVIVFTGGPVRAIRPDGTGLRPFELREACEPTDFSPDGQMVACWPPPGGALGFYVMRRDGSEFHEVPVPSGNSHSPSFSPDGEEVAFVYSRGEYGEARELWRAGIDGEGAHELAPGPDAEPEWSPDGNRIAFIRTGDGLAGCIDGGSLVVIGAEGGEERVSSAMLKRQSGRLMESGSPSCAGCPHRAATRMHVPIRMRTRKARARSGPSLSTADRQCCSLATCLRRACSRSPGRRMGARSRSSVRRAVLTPATFGSLSFPRRAERPAPSAP